LANVIALIFVLAVTAVWIAVLVRFRLRWWTVLLSILMLLFLLVSLFRPESS